MRISEQTKVDDALIRTENRVWTWAGHVIHKLTTNEQPGVSLCSLLLQLLSKCFNFIFSNISVSVLL